MTVENQTTKVTAGGNGVATVFSFSPMVIFASGDLQVTFVSTAGVETLLTEGTGAANYSVTVSQYPGTGSVTYPASGTDYLASGESLVMKRLLTIEQQTNLENQGGYFPDTQENALDKLTMIDLQQQEAIDRCPKLAVSDTSGADLTLPTPVARRAVMWNAAADGLENSDYDPDAQVTLATAQAAIATTQAGLAATARAAAETAETNAEAAQAAAEAAQAAAEAAQAAAEASAAAAAAAAASKLFGKISNVATAARPVTITADTDDGRMYVVANDGNVTFNLPLIATAGEGERYGFLREGASHTVALARSGTDTINGVAGSYTIAAAAGELVVVFADDSSPDNWIVSVWTQALAGAGLTKTGSVISLDITGQTAETVAADADYVIVYDVSAAAFRKMTRANFISGSSATDDSARYQALLNALVERRKSGTQGGTGLVNGHVDAYLSDTIGVASTDETYDATGDYYNNRPTTLVDPGYSAGSTIAVIIGAGYTIINIKDALVAGDVITAISVNCAVADTGSVKIVRRDSAGNYTVMHSTNVTFGAGGEQSHTLSAPYTVPAGLEYFVAAYAVAGNLKLTSGNYTPSRANYSGDATGAFAATEFSGNATLWMKYTKTGAITNMTLQGTAVSASVTPTTAWFVALVDPVSAVTYNTDYTARITSDNATYDTLTLTNVGSYDGTYDILVGKVTLTGASNSMNYRKVTANSKELRDAGVAYMWG